MRFKSLLLGLGLLVGSFLPTFAQTSECISPVTVHQMIEEANPGESMNQIIMTGKRAQWFQEAYQSVVGQPAPTFDTLSLYPTAEMVIVVGFSNGCAVGAARLPFSTYTAIRMEMEKRRAASE
jgi:hypothetical protein